MPTILTINGGSSSIRFAVFEVSHGTKRTIAGKLERLGTAEARLHATRDGQAPEEIALGGKDSTGVSSLVEWLTHTAGVTPDAIGHRVVHGMSRDAPERITGQLLQALSQLLPFDSEHLPREIELIEALEKHYPGLAQVACFDTAFHHHMPNLATLLPIARKVTADGIRRYGFHGLSYTYLMQELRRLNEPRAERGRLILAHLGSGASMAAIRDGRCIDTSMGFTPNSGFMMGTRSGDLDPGLLNYLLQQGSMTPASLQTLLTRESGLLGVSQRSADVRDLLAAEQEDPRAAEALALFCYQVKKWLGAYAAALGGVDTLVFSGGVGENAAPIRARICADLDYLGLRLDAKANEAHAPLISSKRSRVTVRVIKTDEEIVIAQLTGATLGFQPGSDAGPR
jgi:acetate kinase